MDGKLRRFSCWGIIVILIGLVLYSINPQNNAGAQAPVIGDLGNILYMPVITKNALAPDEATRRIQVPEGFQIRIFAEGLTGKIRFMAFGPDGQLYASLYSAGQIVRLPDRNKDYLSDGVEIAASGLNFPHGIEWHFADGYNWLYVAELGRVIRLRDGDNNGTLETMEPLAGVSFPTDGGHSTRTVHFGPDGKMYVSVGSTCNVCNEADPRRAAILRYNADGSIPTDNPFASDSDVRKRPVYAWGLRNSVDFLWTKSGALWADHNGRDGLGNDLPPEEVIIPVVGNHSHGWPYCYTVGVGVNLPTQSEIVDTASGLTLPGGFSCNQAVPALVTDLAHAAPLGMTLGTGSGFPADYQDDVFIAYHGSWNTTPDSFRDCKVQRVVIVGGVPVRTETFANGWRAAGKSCGDSASWGRPADVIFGPDGGMYISDDAAGRVYRIQYRGY